MTDWSKLEVQRAFLEEPQVLVYRLKGGLTESPTSYSFLEQVRNDCRKTSRKVIVNLKDVEHLNSTGSGILTAAFTSVTNAGGHMCLSGLSNRAEAILNVIRFLYIVGHTDTEEEALQYLRKY